MYKYCPNALLKTELGISSSVTAEQMHLFAAGVEDIHGKECGRIMGNSATVMSEIEMSLMSEMGSKVPDVQGNQV